MDHSAPPENGKPVAKHGFEPDLLEKTLRLISSGLIQVLRLHGRSRFSNIFIQQLDPFEKVPWTAGGKTSQLKFRTGHGRLWWRARTFYSEEPMMIRWLKSLKPDDIFLDIGANVGTYAIPAALQAKMVYACELDPMNIGLLKENIHLNGVHSKVVIFPFAATERHELVDIYYRDFSRGDALQSINRETPLNTVTGSGRHVCRQLSFPLDDIFKTFGLPLPNKVKIDVDGNEATLFRGAAEVIGQASEVYFEDGGLKDCAEVLRKLEGLGFQVVEQEAVKLGRNLLLSKPRASMKER
jgi:FkbM family methyltransferase